MTRRGKKTDIRIIAVALVFFVAMVGTRAAYAAYGRIPDSHIDPTVTKIDEKAFLGAKLDGDYVLVDGEGREFTLGGIFDKPLILVLAYYGCDGVCTTVNKSLAEKIAGSERVKPGEDFNVLTLSFDKLDDAGDLKMFSKEIGAPDTDRSGWKLALMKDADDIEKLTSSIGYRFFWSMSDKVFLHPNVLVVVSPGGRVNRYLYGAAAGTSDIEAAVAEARFGKTGSIASDLKDLYSIACYSYNFKEGRYTLNYPLFIAAGSLFGGVSLVTLSIVVFKRKAGR